MIQYNEYNTDEMISYYIDKQEFVNELLDNKESFIKVSKSKYVTSLLQQIKEISIEEPMKITKYSSILLQILFSQDQNHDLIDTFYNILPQHDVVMQFIAYKDQLIAMHIVKLFMLCSYDEEFNKLITKDDIKSIKQQIEHDNDNIKDYLNIVANCYMIIDDEIVEGCCQLVNNNKEYVKCIYPIIMTNPIQYTPLVTKYELNIC